MRDSNQPEKPIGQSGPDRLTVNIGPAGEVELSVYAALDSTYGKIFVGAVAELRSDPSNLQVSVRAILFGCFWVEATCNRVLEEALKRYLPVLAFPVLWKTLARRPILEKFSILASFRDSKTLAEATNIASGLTKAIQLRNKLVHFQDDELVVARQVVPDDLEALFAGALADHPFVADIRASAFKIVESIQPSIDWLESISTGLSRSS